MGKGDKRSKRGKISRELSASAGSDHRRLAKKNKPADAAMAERMVRTCRLPVTASSHLDGPDQWIEWLGSNSGSAVGWCRSSTRTRLMLASRDRDRTERSAQAMAKLRLLKTGHGDLTLAEWDKNHPDSVAAPRPSSPNISRPGRMAFRLDGPGQSRVIREFDATAPEILIVPAVQGG